MTKYIHILIQIYTLTIFIGSRITFTHAVLELRQIIIARAILYHVFELISVIAHQVHNTLLFGIERWVIDMTIFMWRMITHTIP